jgi:GTP cyclohydrolase I
MGVALESAIPQDRSMALVLTEETKTGRLERIVRDLMTELGLDITDEHFEGTPARVARLYRELGGKMHFGYVPDGKIVGLSKIPRLIQAMASRPIVQEAFGLRGACYGSARLRCRPRSEMA